MEKNRNILVEAIGRRGVAMCRYYLEFEGKGTSDPEFESLGSACSLNNINDLWCFILKFVDASDPKVRKLFFSFCSASKKQPLPCQ